MNAGSAPALPLVHFPSHCLPRCQVGDALAANYVAGNPNSALVLGRLWGLDADIVMRAMCVLYERDPTAVFRILDVSQVQI